MKKLDEEIWRTIHYKGRFKQIAEENKIKTSTLYRYGLPIENNGLNIPLNKLAGIMAAAGYYGILHHLAAQCRRLVVLIPGMPKNKLAESDLVQSYQCQCHDAVSYLIDFFKHPTKDRYNSMADAMKDVAVNSFSIIKSLQNYHQLEFSF